MRLLLALAGISLLAGSSLAQDTLGREVKLPGGQVITRKCLHWESEGILILTADHRYRGTGGDAYLAQLANSMERRLTHVVKDSAALVAYFAAKVMRDGSVSGVRLMQPSGRAGFDLDAQRALSIGPNDALLDSMPMVVPDSLNVFISIGHKQDGSKFLITHDSCDAVEYPNSPKTVYPITETLSRARTIIHTSFVVDTDGAVDTASIKVLTETSDAFGDATLDYLATLKYLPAEFDGKKERSVVYRDVEFFIPEQSGEGFDR